MRRLMILLIVALFAAGFPGCKSKGVQYHDGRIEVRLWHSMGGVNGDALGKIVDGYNGSQDTYEVTAVYQGGYPDSVKKLVASIGTSSMPSLIQLADFATQFMVDGGATVPAQDFIDQDPAGSLADFEPRAIDYYSLNGKLLAMPFNLSGPVLYYDKDAFRAAGLDPDQPPATLEEVRADSEKLMRRSGGGSEGRNGIALTIDAWFFEEMLAKQGTGYANNDNGRTSRADRVAFDGAPGETILRWWKEMVDSGLATNVGRQGLQALLLVLTGKSAKAIASSASMRAILLAVGPEGAQRFGVGPMPAPPGRDGGMIVGGAAMWILKDRPPDEQQGAWQFLKYATSPQVQAQWSADTGYFPLRLSAWDMEPAASLHQQYPQLAIARDQLLRSPRNYATAGALIGPFAQVRESVENAFEQALVGGKTARQALDQAAREANRAIDRYNRSVE
jgi:sn-glycerol 3-phosphate transport system substrate-binding protein